MATDLLGAEQVLTPAGFTAALKLTLEAEIQIYPARAWYPSSIGHPCDRYLVWERTRWQEKQRHDWVLQSIFDEGRLHQPSIYARLEAMGFEVIRESDRPTQLKVGNAVISGRPDGRIRGYRGARFSPPRVLEAKTTQGHTFDRLDTIEDIRHAPEHYIRAYADQGYTYCALENLPQGVIVIKAKSTGLLKVIPFEQDFGRAEWLQQRVERLQGMVDQAVDPEPIPYDFDVCGRCAFLARCYPPKNFGEGATVIEDQAFVEALIAREELKTPHAAYEDIDKAVKTRLKREGVKSAIAGPFVIEGTERQVKAYEVKARTDVVFKIERVADVLPPAPAPDTVALPATATPAAPAGSVAPTQTEIPMTSGAPAASAADEAAFPELFGERQDKLAAIERARGALSRQPPAAIWAAFCRELCGTEDLERADVAALGDLLAMLDGVNRHERKHVERANAIAKKAKGAA